MSNEIKEILDKWNKVCNNELEYVDLTRKQMKILLNYITNLQEIIDKAIEYIKENIADIDFIKKEYDEKTLKNPDIETTFIDIENLLNILKGSENK